jgi:hypothetical protein
MTIEHPITRCLATCLLLTLAGTAARAAPPQTVYRCGPEGRVYSQTPCADGKVVTIEDSRSDQRQKAAREVAERDAQQARTLAEQRRQREAAAAGQGITGIKSAPAESPASAPPRKKKSKADTKTAPADSNMSPPMRAVPQAAASK